MQQDASVATNLRDVAHRLNYARLIVGCHDRDQPRLRPDRAGELVKSGNSISRHIEPGHLKVFALFQILERVQYRMVLGFIRYDVAAA